MGGWVDGGMGKVGKMLALSGAEGGGWEDGELDVRGFLQGGGGGEGGLGGVQFPAGIGLGSEVWVSGAGIPSWEGQGWVAQAHDSATPLPPDT